MNRLIDYNNNKPQIGTIFCILNNKVLLNWVSLLKLPNSRILHKNSYCDVTEHDGPWKEPLICGYKPTAKAEGIKLQDQLTASTPALVLKCCMSIVKAMQHVLHILTTITCTIY